MIRKLIFAGACFGVLGFFGPAPAQADGWHRPFRHKAYGPVRHYHHHAFRHHAFRPRWPVQRYYGYSPRVAAPIWRPRLAVPVVRYAAAPVVGVSYVQPVYAVASPCGYAFMGSACGSYAAPVGYYGVVYNRPFGSCSC